MGSSSQTASATDEALLRIATRRSRLALWQAEFVREQLQRTHRELRVELVTIQTRGDRILDRPLSQVGGKGLFVKELEKALLEQRADLAVHSLKDIPGFFPEGLELSTVLKRDHPGDALILRKGSGLKDLPSSALVGTSSLRRAAQLKHLRPDLEIHPLRGNVTTRLKKLDDGEVDAAVLAVSGLHRLGLEDRITLVLDPKQMLPAIGQGVLGLETRSGDDQTRNLLQFLEDKPTRDCITAERMVLQQLEGNCQVPLAGHCILEKNTLYLRALIAEPDGTRVIRAEGRSSRSEASEMGIRVARSLLDQGGNELLQKLSPMEGI